MSKYKNRSVTTHKKHSFLNTMHAGFNYFHQITFSPKKTPSLHRYRTHLKTTTAQDDHLSLQMLLSENKEKFDRIKTEMNSIREVQLNEYVKKSLKYQEILNINDTKKKRLPTLNTKIGEVVKKSNTQNMQRNVEYTMINYCFKLEGWKPESREGHTTTVYKNTAVIIGGHCSVPFSTAQVYNFERQAWVRQFEVSTPRSYHSSVFYKNRFIIVFGGMGIYDISRKCRVCYNTINLIDLQTWSSRALKMSNEDSIEGRRSHGAILMGKYMLVLGGINTKREFLNDFMYLDLKELKWYHKEYKVQGKQLNENMDTGIARHKIISSFKPTHKNFPLYSSQYGDSEGLLMFGGTFGNGEQNIVLFMGFNKYNPYLRRVDYSGIPPSSIEPVVEKINDNSVVVLSGELNDRSIKLYRIKERQFIGITRFIGGQYYGGIGSTLNRYEQDNYIFFGLDGGGYIGNITSFRIEQKITQTESKKKKERTNDLFQKVDRVFSQSSQSNH